MNSYGDIAAELNIPSSELTDKCSTYRGTFCCWLCRELLYRHYLYILPSDRLELLDMMRILVSRNSRGTALLSNLFDNRHLVFRSQLLNQLALSTAHGNPFGVKY